MIYKFTNKVITLIAMDGSKILTIKSNLPSLAKNKLYFPRLIIQSIFLTRWVSVTTSTIMMQVINVCIF